MPIDLHLRLDSRHLRTFILALIAVEILFVVAHLSLFAVAPESGLRHMFNLDKEYNFPSYFSSMQLFLIGLVLMLLGPLTVGREQVPTWFLVLGGLGFVFLSADEMLGLHERLTRNLATLSWTPRFRDDHGIWIFVYFALLPVILLVVWRPLRALWRVRRSAILLGLVGVGVMVAGAVIVEIPSYIFALRETTGWIYPLQVAVEEFLEMVGATLILLSALRICLDGAMARSAMAVTAKAGGGHRPVAAAAR
jgi:hypothetical protein